MSKPSNAGRIVSPLSVGSRRVSPYLILVLGLLFTFIVSYYLTRLADEQDRSRFKSSVEEIDTSIRTRIQTYVTLLRAGTGLFAASESVTPDEFKRFADQIDLLKNYPGVQGIGYSIRLRPEEVNPLIQSMRRSGLTSFHIWPETPRSEYYAIVYLQPLDRRNEAAIGFDMFTESVRRAAMEQARDIGVPRASGKVTLIQEIDTNKQSGFLIFAPVYRNGAKTSTVDERRAALQGFVYSPFRTDDLLETILKGKKFDIDVQIYDGPVSDNTLLHRSDTSPLLNNSGSPHFIAITTIDVAGRPWTLSYATNAAFDSASDTAYLPY